MLDLLKDYALKRVDLLKMEATEKGVLTVSTIILSVVMAVFALFFLILLNIGIALLIRSALVCNAYGFLIVAGFDLLVVLSLVLAGKSIKDMIGKRLIIMVDTADEWARNTVIWNNLRGKKHSCRKRFPKWKTL